MITPEQHAEIRRLYYGEHWKVGTIAAALAVHHDTVRAAIAHDTHTVRRGTCRASSLDPYLPVIRDTLAQYPRLRATRLFEMVRARGYAGSVVQLRRLVRTMRPATPPTVYRRLTTLMAEEAQIDWGAFGSVRIGHGIRPLSGFVMVLSYSRALFALFTLDQTLASFLRGHVEAFEAFQGAARTLVYDNLRTAVLERAGTAIRFHPRLLELAGHYHFAPRPCTPYRANEKGKIERQIHYLRQAFFAARTFADVDDLNAQFRRWREDIAHQRPHPEQRDRTVADVFAEEQPRLLPLPAHPFETDVMRTVVSGKTPYVRFDRNHYSIPHTHVRRPLTVLASPMTVRVIAGVEEIARHARRYDTGQTIEQEAHVADLIAATRQTNPSSARDRLRLAVPAVARLFERLAARGESLRAQTARLLGLLEAYGPQELAAAVTQALDTDALGAGTIAHLLEQRRRQRRQPPPIRFVLPDHPGVRTLDVTPHRLESYDALILSIACANIANLLLARAAARRREIALRLSLGAGRPRIIRQLLTESALLAALGGSLGVVFAIWGIRFLTLLLANGRENFTLRAELNWPVLVVVGGLSLLTGLLFGLAPALQSTRTDVVPALKESRTGEARGQGFRGMRLSRILVVSQIALTLLVLFAAGLFVRTLSNLASIQLGFNRENLLTFQLNARQAGHNDPEIVAFYDDLRTQFSSIPGVRTASLSDHAVIGTGTSGTPVSVSGAAPEASSIMNIGTGFFATMQIPMLLGREIDERDRPGASLVAVVNEAFAKRNFGDRNPLGQHLAMERTCPKCVIEIVGVSANSLYGDLKGTPPPTVYLSFAQSVRGPVQGMVYELRTAWNPLSYGNAVRNLVQRADPRLPLSDVKSLSSRIDQTINQEIAFARLCTAFALLALVIACVGLYGTMSYNVARRTGEIGIRMALGAQRSRVLWMVLREVLLLTAVGLAISVPTALAASKLVESFLFGMKPNDPLALTGSVVTLVSAAILAGYLPARHASRIDPMVALRHE